MLPTNNTPSQPASQPAQPNDLYNWIVEAINARIAAQAEFTAYDITGAVRNDHPSQPVFHRDVRPQVHSIMQQVIAAGVYDADLRTLPATGAQAYVYFPA